MLTALWQDDAGVILSAELVLILTIAVLAMIVGLSEVAVSINTELNDISNAFGSLDQSYMFSGFKARGGKGYGRGKVKSRVAGSSFDDDVDDCDGNDSCDLVCGGRSARGESGYGGY